MSALAATLDVARSNLAAPPAVGRRRGRPPLPDGELLAAIEDVIAKLPTYGYRRVWAKVRDIYVRRGQKAPNHKRVYATMKRHGLLLQRHTGALEERRHDGTIAVPRSDQRWCSDTFEIACDNAERVRVAFALDCCDREAIRWLATTGGIDGDAVCDLMLESVEQRFGEPERIPARIQWLSDNGSPYTKGDTRKFAGTLGLIPCRTPVRSPQSNGMAEAFVKTMKRDYVGVYGAPDAATVLQNLSSWFEHYNEEHPHKALRYKSPREFRRSKLRDTP